MNLRQIAGATFVAALLSATTLSFAQAQTGRFVDPKDLKWEPVPSYLPAGAQRATLSGDPTKAGPFAYRIKYPAGYRLPAHSHPSDEVVTVIQGTVHFGMGDKLDEKAGHELHPGGVALVPAGSSHYLWTTKEAIIQVNATGPWGLTFVNPNDDPRNKKP
jgi:mannose-6-phosphate isomerase-like protein (cupin superfamily)